MLQEYHGIRALREEKGVEGGAASTRSTTQHLLITWSPTLLHNRSVLKLSQCTAITELAREP
jgi:hypothetical protein